MAEDGGNAFPGQQELCPDGTWNQTYEPGMSLRDYLAAHAPDAPGVWLQEQPEVLNTFGEKKAVNAATWLLLDARWRYTYADAMLKQRETGDE